MEHKKKKTQDSRPYQFLGTGLGDDSNNSFEDFTPGSMMEPMQSMLGSD